MSVIRTTLLSLATLLPGQVQAQEPATDDIVVTGIPLSTTEQALANCLARGCPPEEDMRLSLAHAENQFVAGDYRDSRSTLRDSLDRNRKHGDRFPVPVSDLYRASARVAEHLGEGKSYQLATLDMRDVLKGGLGKQDPRALAAEIEVGDSRAKLGFPDEARNIYSSVEDRAVDAGLNRVATLARVRKALSWQAQYNADPSEYYLEKMRAELNKVRNDPLPGTEEFALVADVVEAKLDRSRGKTDSTEELIARFAARGGVDRPTLLYSEPLKSGFLTKSDAEGGYDGAPPANTLGRLTALSRYHPRWVDIGFWIEADGHVDDVQVLRSEGPDDWILPVAKNIAKRIYAPIDQEKVGPGFYMVERYTLTARIAEDRTGSRIRGREPYARIERIDLTPENYGRPEDLS